jgi:cytochrome c
MIKTLSAFTALAVATPVLAQAGGDAAAKLYTARCGTCHSIAASKIGPAHRGVVGRTAGTYPGYAYSPAIKASKIVWTPANIDMWLQGPQKMVKGSKMFFTVPNASERAAIVAYLSSPAGR